MYLIEIQMHKGLQCIMLNLLIGSILMECKPQLCYKLKFLDFNCNDIPDYRLSITRRNQYSLFAVTRVLKAVKIPIWHIKILHYPTKRNLPPKILYNGNYKTCEFWKYIKNLSTINQVAEQLFAKTGSNMSLECPMPVGTYTMQNIEIPPDSALLKYMYWPNTMYTIIGIVYEQGSNKTLKKLCQYEMNSTVVKTC